MNITQDKVVGLTYKLRDGDGNEIEDRTEDDPLYYLHGRSNIIPGLEEALDGLEEGDEFDINLDAEDAYGEYNPELVQTVDRSELEEPEGEELQVGRAIDVQIETEDGKQFPFTMLISEIKEDEVILDGNHPLAGEDLGLSGEVLEVREASEQELQAGNLEEAPE
jgi:FKBP-type peptidyl-prolyl cis-trans isomerase SlyD